jgi:hypothetical protein
MEGTTSTYGVLHKQSRTDDKWWSSICSEISPRESKLKLALVNTEMEFRISYDGDFLTS